MSTRAFAGKLNVPCPSATELSTIKTPVKVDPGVEPARLMVVVVPSLSKNDRGPGTLVTGTDEVNVTVTLPAAVGEGSPRVTLAVGADEPPNSDAPTSHALPLIDLFSAYEGSPYNEAKVLLMLVDRPVGIPMLVPASIAGLVLKR